MRFRINFISDKKIQFSKDINIRSVFISFIKKTFENENKLLYNSLFSIKKARPYVFSPYFGEGFKEKEIGKEISFIFSSGDFSIFSAFWNGLLALKEKGLDYIKIKENKFSVQDITLLPAKKIKSNQVVFKTVGISVLTAPSAKANDFKKWYIIPEKENIERFNEILRKRTAERLKFIKGVEKEVKLEFLFFEKKPIIETIVPHYNGYVRGFRGNFILKGDIEVLQFLYDYGLGVRTGQGFGLLDIVKE